MKTPKKMKHLKVGNVAFWRYDLPGKPFLGGTITEIRTDSDGWFVQTEEFGVGHFYRVAFCLPKQEGDVLLSELEILEIQLDNANKLALNWFRNCVKNQLPKGVEYS